MEYQVFQPSSSVDNSVISHLKDIPYLYLQEISGVVEFLYVPTEKEERAKVLLALKGVGVEAKPEVYHDTSGVLRNLYLQEQDIRKHLYKASKKVKFVVGDVVYLKEYKDLPFKVTKIEGLEVHISHELKFLHLNLKIDAEMLETRKENTPFYKRIKALEPRAKLFLDADIFMEGDDLFALLSEMWTIKLRYPQRELVVMNPLPKQMELLKVLGVRHYQGYKKSIIYQKFFDKDLDLIYSNNLLFLNKVDKVIILKDRCNIKIPTEVLAKEVELLQDYGFGDVTYRGEISKKIAYKDLDYMGIRAYFKSNKLKAYLGDLGYYLRIIKM